MKSMLYTRTGDRGTTALVGGSRVAKNDPRVNAYGSVDELNSLLGLLLACIKCLECLEEDVRLLTKVQNTMFDIGSYLATPEKMDNADSGAKPAVSHNEIEEIEHAVDRLDSSVPPQNCFILPGGCVAACHAHVARSTCRRAEREIYDLIDTGAHIDEGVTCYVNRLSDYLFILARALNHVQGVADTPWVQSR